MQSFKEIFEARYTWVEGFMRNVRRYPHKPALIHPEGGRAWSYAELNRDANRLANALISDGLRRGRVVMMQLLNCPEFVFTYIATQKAQGVSSPVSYRLSPGELAKNLEDSRPMVVMFDERQRASVLEAIRISGTHPKRLITIDGPTGGGITSYADYVAPFPDDEPRPAAPYNIYDETTRLYTSGTTGRPKGVPLTSINEVLSAHDVMIMFPLNYRDVTMNTTPWFHRGGLHCAGPCPTLYAGATLVIMPKFSAERTLRYVQRYDITFVVGVPTVLENLADEQERQGYDLSSLRGIVTMGSPLERGACMRYQKVLTPNIFNGYGTTETFWNTFLRPFDLPEHAGTAGMACVDDDVRVVRVYEDRPAAPTDLVARDGQEVGEVIISSPAKSPFLYVSNPRETARKYRDGFIYTNDLATWDERQFITICGRKDDMIISSGENIYPTEIEAVLNQHPKVKDCIVTAVPDKVRGQKVTAYVVRADAALTAEELDGWCKSSPDIANFKRPRYYRFIQQLPLSATGKKLHARIKRIAADDLKNGLLYEV